MRKLFIFVQVLVYLLAIGCGGGGGSTVTPPPPPPPQNATWTVMTYMGGDNNLADAAINDIQELEQVGSTSRVHFTVLADVYYKVSGDFGTYVTALRDSAGQLVTPMMRVGYHPEAGVQSHLTDPAAVLYENVGFNSADPNNLKRFIQWSAQTYPADHYALIVWNHGNSWLPGRAGSAAVSDDYEGGGNAMFIHEISAAIAGSGVNLSILDFDACNMGSLEVAYQFINDTSYFCASQKTEPGDGNDFHAMAAYLTTNPQALPETLGKVIVDTYINFYAAEDQSSVTRSLIRTDRLEAVASQTLQLSGQLTDPAIISSANLLATFYDPVRFYRDVDFMNYLDVLAVGYPGLTPSLDALKASLQDAIVYNRVFTSSANYPVWTWGSYVFGEGEELNVNWASGLSVFLPVEADWNLGNFGYYTSIGFPEASGWDDVIAYANQGVPFFEMAPGRWFAVLAWSTDVDLDFWVFEPNGYAGLYAACPAWSYGGFNGYLSSDSYYSGISAEAYEAFPSVMGGPYYFIAEFYSGGPSASDAYCQLAIGGSPDDQNPLRSGQYYISASQPVDPDFGPGVMYLGYLLYDPVAMTWYYNEYDRSAQAADGDRTIEILNAMDSLESMSPRQKDSGEPGSDQDLVEQYHIQGLALAQDLIDNLD